MGFLDIFKTKSRRNSTGSSTTADSSSSGERQKRSAKKKRSGQEKEKKVAAKALAAKELSVPARIMTAPKAKQADAASVAAAIEAVKRYWEAFHARDYDEMKKYCEDRYFINFLDTDLEMPLNEYLEIWKGTVESFPDFALEMNLDDIKPEECNELDDGTIIVYIRNVRAKGTHSGKPYSFGPFPEVPARGIFVRDVSPNTNAMHIRNGKVYRNDIKTNGSSDESGPAYFYEQVGGVLF